MYNYKYAVKLRDKAENCVTNITLYSILGFYALLAVKQVICPRFHFHRYISSCLKIMLYGVVALPVQ